MQIHSIFKKFLFILFLLFFSFILFFIIFQNIFLSDQIIIDLGFRTLNLSENFPFIWKNIKLCYFIFHILSWSIISNSIYETLFHKFHSKLPSIKNLSFHQHKKDSSSPENHLNLLVGLSSNTKEEVYLPEKSLYQNVLITGTIGSGKTSSAMYPFSEQLIKYVGTNHSEKLGMLILDVKGNFYTQISNYVELYDRKKDLIIISLFSGIRYNPLDKPNLKSIVLANRLKTILTLFSQNNSDSYWLDMVEIVLNESIKFCRLYNHNYVTFEELHKLVTQQEYYASKLDFLRHLFLKNQLSQEDMYHLLSSVEFFEKELYSLDDRTLSIIRSEITRITNCFISDYQVLKTFSPKKEEINFTGFSDVLKYGKIVVLSMNIAEYRTLSKIIAAYLKLDFQTEVLLNLKNNTNHRSSCFICDEFHEYVTRTDADFFAQSREAKCINIIATQSYSSLKSTLANQDDVKVITQSLVNKLWFRNDDIFTIEEAQKQIGKEDKLKTNKSISENAKETNFNYLTNKFYSTDSNLSESISTVTHFDYIYDTKFFTQDLESFSCLAFLSDGSKILTPKKINLIPYFMKGGSL